MIRLTKEHIFSSIIMQLLKNYTYKLCMHTYTVHSSLINILIHSCLFTIDSFILNFGFNSLRRAILVNMSKCLLKQLKRKHFTTRFIIPAPSSVHIQRKLYCLSTFQPYIYYLYLLWEKIATARYSNEMSFRGTLLRDNNRWKKNYFRYIFFLQLSPTFTSLK